MTATADAPVLPRRLLAAVLLLAAAWQLAMVLHREFNWDEYYFLTLVFRYRQGLLSQPLQTFHVHLFSWLADVAWLDSNRLVAGRLVMLALHLATLGLLYGLARRLVSPAAAVWAVALYASLQFVLVHATSFRADPLVTFLLVGALYLLAARPRHFGALVAAFLATALAILVSIKAVIYLPLIAGLLALQLAGAAAPRRDALRIAGAALLAGLAFALAFAAHAQSLGLAPEAEAHDLAAIATVQFGAESRFSALRFLLLSMQVNAIFYVLALGGAAMAIAGLLKPGPQGRGHAALLLLFTAPLLLPAVYRNSFPYAYVFLMPTVAIVAGAAAQRVAHYRAALLLLVAVGIAVTLPAFTRDQAGQRQVEAAVHRMFPDAIAYFDRSGMIASYPLANDILSSWGLEAYLRAGQPVFAEAIATLQPPMLMATHPVLEEALGLPPFAPTGGYALLAQDAAALRDAYIPHWGPLWVAGKQLAASGQDTAFDLPIPGTYTFEAAGPATIDGKPVAAGEAVTLAAGRHLYAGPAATLRYGDHLYRPEGPPPAPFFLGF